MAETKRTQKSQSKSTKASTPSKRSGATSSSKRPTATKSKASGAAKTGRRSRASTKPAKAAEAKAAEAKQAEKGKPSLPTLDEALEWIGMRIDGLGSRTLGRVAGIHVDAKDGKPRWALVRMGPLAGCTAIPFEHVAEGAGRLWAAYERDWIRSGPKVKPSESFTALQELELCEHWSIREDHGRAAQVADQPAEEITAVPAED